MRPGFVGLDRDGTIIESVDHLGSPDGVRLIPGAAAGIRRLNEAGVPVVVLTNQSAVGRGWLTHAALDEIHDRLRARLASERATLDAIYYCPHRPDEGCSCRKPQTGLLEQAAGFLGVNTRDAVMVGDNISDIQMAVTAGAAAIHVRTGVSGEPAQPWRARSVADLGAAVDLILGTQPDPVFDEGLRLRIRQDFRLTAQVLLETAQAAGDAIGAACTLIARTFTAGGRLLICGNGGSAADSQHMAAELVSSFGRGVQRRGLPALALTTDSSVLTAYSNDFDFEGVFARQVQAHGSPGDCLLVISTSGASPNILAAAGAARANGVAVVALTGGRPTELARMADVHVAVPSADTQAIQAAHLVVEHLICHAAEQAVVRRTSCSPES